MARVIETARGAMTASELRDQLVVRAGENEEFRARLMADPKATLREDYDIDLPENLNLYVHEDDATTAHIVLPRSRKLTETELQAAAGGSYY